MREEGMSEIRIRRSWLAPAAIAILATALVVGVPAVRAQKVQQDFKDKLNIAAETGGVAVATSADGKYVYVVGRQGILVSDDHGKVGSWTQTASFK